MTATLIASSDTIVTRGSCIMCGEDLGTEGVLVECQGSVLTFRSWDCLRRFMLEPEPSRALIAAHVDAHGGCWPPSEWCL